MWQPETVLFYSMNNRLSVLFIIAFNLAPLAGAIFFNWQPFEALWFFWMETLIMAVFNCIKIVFSQHRDLAVTQTDAAMVYHIGKAFRYLLVRIGIFLFYSIFIITFIGYVANNNTDKSGVLTTLLFQNRFFNLSLLISIFAQGYYLLFYFFRNRTFITAVPEQYASWFDSKLIIIHLVVVLGSFGSTFLIRQTSLGAYSGIVIIGIFCLFKCAVDLFNYEKVPEINVE